MKHTLNRRHFIGAVTAPALLALTRCNANRPLRVLYFIDPPESRLITDDIAKFKNETGISVEFQALSYDKLRKELEKSFTGIAKPYDVIFVDDIWLREFAESSNLTELSSFIKEDRNFIDFRSDYNVTILNAEAYWPQLGDPDSKLWLIPHRADVQVLFYNRAIFLDPSVNAAFFKKTQRPLQVPDTWEDYVATAKGLTGLLFRDRSIFGCAETLQPSHFAFEFFACRFWAFAGKGSDFFKGDEPLFASPAGVKAIRHFQELLEAEACTSGSLGADHNATIAAMSSGYVALCPQWYTFYPTLKKAINDLGVALLPGVPSENAPVLRCPSIGGGSFGLPVLSERHEWAWAFIHYFTGKPFSEHSAQLGAVVPRNSTYQKPEVKSAIPELEKYLNSLEISRFRPRVPRFSEVETIIGDAVSIAIKSPREQTKLILEEAANNARAIIRGSGMTRP